MQARRRGRKRAPHGLARCLFPAASFNRPVPGRAKHTLASLAAASLAVSGARAVDAVFSPDFDRAGRPAAATPTPKPDVPMDAGPYAPDGRAKFGRNRAMAHKANPAWSAGGFNPGIAGTSDAAANDFLAEVAALAREAKWDEVTALAGQEAKDVPPSLRTLVKAVAAYQTRDSAGGTALLRTALEESARTQRLPIMLQMADKFGRGLEADELLLALCEDKRLAPAAFAAARPRFSQSGKLVALEQAFTRARASAPRDATIVDYARYLRLLDGQAVSADATAKAVSANPLNPIARTTHALALLRADRRTEAKSVIEVVKMDPVQLPPGVLAVAAAVYAANNDSDTADKLIAFIKVPNLLPGEKALVESITKPEE